MLQARLGSNLDLGFKSSVGMARSLTLLVWRSTVAVTGETSREVVSKLC